MLHVRLQHFISLLCHNKPSKQTAGLLAGNRTEQLNVTEGGGAEYRRFQLALLPFYSSLTGMTPGLHLRHWACSVSRLIEAYFIVMTNSTLKKKKKACIGVRIQHTQRFPIKKKKKKAERRTSCKKKNTAGN